jgi:hypothetical protein
MNIDPFELEHARRKQKMWLARYARQSLLQWDDVPVREIREWVEVLRELLEGEDVFRRAEEEG